MEFKASDISDRSEEITRDYFRLLDKHIADVITGRVSDFMEINQIAGELCLSHQHLTDTIKKQTGNHPCHYYDLKIIEQAKIMLSETDKSVSEIARILTYDPSNFSKFFKKFVGQTAGQFRKNK
ncbi:hypothetical protein GCM10007415_25820 [Parapedobacter pyrenivorans]|uniref:HTH araC/xylS-type domain-containing protein n=1 Tax=Parapedobacter pyrenivorans TaxID=1305674 RepID=A0A917MBY8_9SPHI|nr:AraC family transcriptional regulator [Parapedobacter pyrenivorans]GGG90237.1 hypothetical protein GCM10007415_25820 [Parapedobacter pyrenivorans]